MVAHYIAAPPMPASCLPPPRTVADRFLPSIRSRYNSCASAGCDPAFNGSGGFTRDEPSNQPGDQAVAFPEIDLLSPLKICGVVLLTIGSYVPEVPVLRGRRVGQDWYPVHLGSRAVGGVALVPVEVTAVTRDGRIFPGDLEIRSEQAGRAAGPNTPLGAFPGSSRRNSAGGMPGERRPAAGIVSPLSSSLRSRELEVRCQGCHGSLRILRLALPCSQCQELRVVRGMEGVIHLVLGMDVANGVMIVIIFCQFTGELVQKAATILDAWKQQHLLLDPGKYGRNGGRAVDPPFPQRAVLMRLLSRIRVIDCIQRGGIAQLVQQKSVIDMTTSAAVSGDYLHAEFLAAFGDLRHDLGGISRPRKRSSRRI